MENQYAFNLLPLELQASITKDLNLSTATNITTSSYNANKVRQCTNFQLSSIKSQEYITTEPFILYEYQKGSTGLIYNANPKNTVIDNITFGLLYAEGDDNDYIVISEIPRDRLYESDFDVSYNSLTYPVKYDLDLLSLYKIINDLNCDLYVKNFTKNEILNKIRSDNDVFNHHIELINQDINNLDIEDIHISYYNWFEIIKNYIYIFTSASLLNLIDYRNFWEPFGEWNADRSWYKTPTYTFTSETMAGENKYDTVINNIQLLNKIVTVIDNLNNQIISHFINL